MKKKDKIKNALQEILYIQCSNWSSINAANVKTRRVDSLNKILDNLSYKGNRPPVRWKQLPKKYYT